MDTQLTRMKTIEKQNRYLQKLFTKKNEKLLEDIPVISSFLALSGDTRYHWIEHSESSGALLEQGWICKYEPNVSVPSNSYKWGTFSSPFFSLANWKVKWKKISDNLEWKTIILFLNLIKETYQSLQFRWKKGLKAQEINHIRPSSKIIPTP